jgi:hypothetical protein
MHHDDPAIPRHPLLPRLLPLLTLVMLAGGCAMFDAVGRAVPGANTPARYRGLQNQSVGVMVWADRGMLTDFPAVQVDLATAVQRRLQESRSRDLLNTTFPVDPRSIVRYQHDHPVLARQPVVEVAPRFGVSRLIYIELERFDTRSEASLELFRGFASATLRVVEVDDDGQARIAYEEAGISAVFPPNAPPEGMAGANDFVIYRGTITQLSGEITRRLIAHQAD